MATNLKRSPPARIEFKEMQEVRAGRERMSDAAFLLGLGRKVREAREQRGLARKTLAEAAEVSERYLAQLEMGGGNASVVLLRRVANALNVRMTYLLAADAAQERSLISSFLESLPDQRLEQVLQRLVGDFGTDEFVRRKRVALIGLRGAGKSTLGSALAKVMRRPFVELDREVELEAGMALSEIFLLYGPAGYRNLERQCLERVVAAQRDVVLSVGGGVVSEADNYQLLLNNCFTIWIKASPAEHMSRVIAQGDLRPMRGHERAMEDLKEILSSREALYGRADAVVDTSGQSVTRSIAALRAAIAPKLI